MAEGTWAYNKEDNCIQFVPDLEMNVANVQHFTLFCSRPLYSFSEG